jgi:hypothetical protein
MNQPHCTHTYDETNDIHAYTFHEPSRRAVDEWLDLMELVYQERRKTPDKRVKIMMDIGEFTLPVRYTIRSIRKWQNDRPDRATTNIAVLYHDNPMLAMVKTMVNNMPMVDTLHFYPAEQKEKARAWLTR